MKTFLKTFALNTRIEKIKYFQKFNSFKFSNFNKNPSECYYKVLNSSPSSDIDSIKKEYYKLAKKYHPDNKNSDSKDNQTVK